MMLILEKLLWHWDGSIAHQYTHPEYGIPEWRMGATLQGQGEHVLQDGARNEYLQISAHVYQIKKCSESAIDSEH